MNDQFDKVLNKSIQQLGNSTALTDEQKEIILKNIHIQIRERGFPMKINNYKKCLIALTALMILGTMTVIASGKIASYYSSVNTANIDFTNASELIQAKDVMGTMPKAPQEFKNGLVFNRGYLIEVKAVDEAGVTVATYPELSIEYGEELTLAISKPLKEDDDIQHAAITETYQDIELRGFEDEYLFLPPNEVPSEADQVLEAKGLLSISYGTDQQERQTIRNVQWQVDELTYRIYSFGDVYSMDELITMAKEIIALK